MLADLKSSVGHRDIGQRAGPAAPHHRRGGRRRPPAAARRRRRAAHPHRRLPQRLPGPRGGTADRAGRNPIAAPELDVPLQLIAAALADAARRRSGCNSCAARSPPSRSRTACSTATPGWCRSTRWAANRRTSVSAWPSSIARSHPGPALAAGDDDAVDPRHQARRGRARPHRRAVAGAVAVDGVRQPLGDGRPSPDPATGLFLWQNIFGVWPADGEVTDELATGCTPTPRRRSGRRRGTPRGMTRTPTSRALCTAGWTTSSTARWCAR